MPNQELTKEECVLRYVIERYALDRPNDNFLYLRNEPAWTYSDLLRRTRQMSGALHELGLRQYDNLFCWLPNGTDFLECWFGANYMGALFISANTAYRGDILAHILNLANAEIGIVHVDLLPRLLEIDVPHLKKIVVVGGEFTQTHPTITLLSEECLRREDVSSPEVEDIQPWDNCYVIYTSGTTGLSKAVLSSYVHAFSFCYEAYPAIFGPDERLMVFLPMYHVGGVATLYGQLVAGGSVELTEPFNTSTFWDTVRETGSTTCFLIGAMAPFLLNQPPSDTDHQHGLRAALAQPMTKDIENFPARFGVNLISGYGMTEAGVPMSWPYNPEKPRSCGRLRPGYDIKLVDEYDYEVPCGTPGELVVRCDRPWAMLTEYYQDPAATAQALRNGWFHTGDLMYCDDDGYFYFVDRKKDAIRRRGENVSSYEVELTILKHPDVAEAAIYAVKNPTSEEEIMACIALKDDCAIVYQDLVEFMQVNLPYFMIPRYIRIMDSLPKTPTGKIRKQQLREDAVTDDSWDREAAGIIFKRERIGEGGFVDRNAIKVDRVAGGLAQ